MQPDHSVAPLSGARPWNLRLALGLLAVQFGGQLLFLAIALAVLPAVIDLPAAEIEVAGSAVTIVLGLAAYLFAGATTLELARHLAHRLGYHSLRQAVGLVGTRLWIAGIAVALVTALISDSVSLALGRPIVPPEYRSTFSDIAAGISFGAFTTLVPPIVEEVVFRGILYPALERAYNPTVAVLLNAAIFGLVHVFSYGADWYVIGLTAFTGVALAALRAYSGSLWPSVAAHATINAYASLEALVLPRLLGYWW